MVVASSRLLSLVTSQISRIHHRPFVLLRLARRHTLTIPLPTLADAPNYLHRFPRRNVIPIILCQNFYSRATKHVPATDYHVPPSHPWPEWSRLLESLSAVGYFNANGNIEDEFVANDNLSLEFVAAANSCLVFARDRPDMLRWLSRKDIEVLIDGGHPFLFKSAHETERRMRSFLQAEGLNEARLVDLMKYILSYASHPIIYPETNIKEATEFSVRNLLQEMANLSSRDRATEQSQVVGRGEQMPRNLGPNITMKRGDWICPKCSFMNFARNSRCLECEELRPQRLTDGNWDCPRCNFYNFRRNSVCLKCECKRPDEAPRPGPPGQAINSHYPNTYYGNNGTPGVNNYWETNNLGTSNHFHGNSSSVSGTNKSFDRRQNDSIDSRSSITMESNSSHVLFVPLPSDMFAKKSENMANEHSEGAAVRTSVPLNGSEDSQLSEKSTSYVQSRHTQDTDTEDRTARWFKKVKDLHGVTEPTSGIFHDKFPQTMSVHKGETNDVDNKKNKDQPYFTHQRQQAMEQGSSSSFSPFVPFPPGYFTKKDNQQQPRSTDPAVKPTDTNEISFSHSQENLNNCVLDKNLVQDTGNQQNMMNVLDNCYSSSSIGKGSSFGDTNNSVLDKNPVQDTGIQHELFSILNDLDSRSSVGKGSSFGDTNTDSSTNQFNRHETKPETSNLGQKTPEKLNVSGWTGKSLEGSAVTEPDPLDMSEEAKAERWFRRVAHIKDISELSQIPDEDFPSIMPMRKGVNRFVVSKRKTPLERRLTSPQYRKNLRIMSSEPLKKEGDDDN